MPSTIIINNTKFIIILIILYIVYFYLTLNDFGNESGFKPFFSALGVISINTLYFFTLIYCVFAVLVILFNLPTSSVFEQKLIETINFQKLSQSRNTGQNEDQVYEILLDSAASVSVANVAWLDKLNSEGKEEKALYFKSNKIERIII